MWTRIVVSQLHFVFAFATSSVDYKPTKCKIHFPLKLAKKALKFMAQHKNTKWTNAPWMQLVRIFVMEHLIKVWFLPFFKESNCLLTNGFVDLKNDCCYENCLNILKKIHVKLYILWLSNRAVSLWCTLPSLNHSFFYFAQISMLMSCLVVFAQFY